MTDASNGGRERLEFDSDKGSSRSRWVAGGLAAAIIAWMGSGYILPSPDTSGPATGPVTRKAVTVAVRRSAAEQIEQVFVAEGQALPARDTLIRAETSGQIAELLVDKGADLEAGQVIARLDTAARRSDLERAREELSRAQREFDNASELVERGVATVDRVAQARATLAAARAGVSSAEEAIKNTEIRAPFSGRLETLDIETREFISTGADVGRIVDNTPLTIRIQIPQQARADIKPGQSAEVSFITGAEGQGEVTFVGTSADTETRTFLAEVKVANDDGAIPAGISARLRIPTGKASAHFVSPAILSLDTDGTLGIKTVNDSNVVEFHAIDIVRAQTDGIWVSGLPEEAQIISIGQGFVNDGETVDPQPETDGDDPGRQAPVPGAPDLETRSDASGQITGAGGDEGDDAEAIQ
ncbi:efflux RND transporter periplasmic adaptor subunit [Pelagivirga sediminicola]|uniref:Efflux RND transporter periplasmic adaptor subunit n=1 Tax=Pelagivirga sediminicola TaxID=2170575 RepID=A0A2T7GCD9_9RHOB|nr:efflux RND transporter periplasmic adaptor subunit [Pelagivirga sediminicola]PVA12074.1 efflux RND transporter periplasmic adaptor subunit [Pelagivirga sediminicola]